MKLRMTVALAALVTIGLSQAAAADIIHFSLVNPSGRASYLGGSVTFDATVSAPATNAAPVFLNGDSFNVTAPVTLDDSDFVNNFPISLAPGISFTGDLFVLTAPPHLPVGTFLGTFTLLGGPNSSATNTLGTVNFSLTTFTPEPSSIALLLTGLAGLAMSLLWARSKGNAAAGAHEK